jgi:hypothetical protein
VEQFATSPLVDNIAPMELDRDRRALWLDRMRIAVTVYPVDGHIVCVPIPSTPLFTLFEGCGHRRHLYSAQGARLRSIAKSRIMISGRRFAARDGGERATGEWCDGVRGYLTAIATVASSRSRGEQ